MLKYTKKNNVFVFAVTGTIGSGKSVFSKMLSEKLHALYINADEVGHEALKAKQSAIVSIFGEKILDENKSVDRKKLSNTVFSNKKELAKLEAIAHPYIYAQIENIIHSEKKRPVVLEAAVLHKMKIDMLCDVIIYVDSVKKNAIKRLVKRGIPKESVLKIIKTQREIKIMKHKADIIVKNTKDLLRLGQIADNIGRHYDREQEYIRIPKKRCVFK